jgi:serine/threonine protein kinase
VVQNLLLGEDGLVKIADFGISQMLSASGQKLADAAGTPAFMSPELCEGKSFSGQLADVWAIGATMFMLRFGHPPFLAKSIINLYHKICNDPLVFPGTIDPGLKNLLENLLEKDPNKRYTLQQVIMHPWFRHPPAVHAAQQQHRANAAHQGPHGPNSNHPTAVGAYQGPHPATTNNPAMRTTFKPPDSYAAEEEAAMKVPVKIEHHDEVYMSIGGIQKRSKTGSAHHSSDGKIDEDGHAAGSECNSDSEHGGEEAAAEENMMNTEWGADVFQMIDDGDDSDNNIDDDDSVDEDSDNGASSKKKTEGQKSKNGSEGSMFATRTEMTEEEVAKRARRFQVKATKKSNEEMPSSPQRMANESGSSQASGPLPVKGKSTFNGVAASSEPPSEASSSAPTPKVQRLPFKSVSTKSGPRVRGESIRTSTASRDDYDGEDADEVSMEDLSKIMDTLAMQPRKHSDLTEEDALQSVKGGLLPIEGFCAELVNKKNGIAAAFNSEKGARQIQEDRCVLCPNASQLKGLDATHMDAAKLEALSQFTVACIFDGHSGWRCAQYLSQHFAPTLVTHERFLDKSCEPALADVCASIDAKVRRLRLVRIPFMPAG